MDPLELLCALPMLLELVVGFLGALFEARRLWRAMKRRQNPTGSPRQFQLLVRVEGNNWIPVPPEANLTMSLGVRMAVAEACDILKAEAIWNQTSKILFTPGEKRQELIICYQQNRPARRILLNEHKTVEIR